MFKALPLQLVLPLLGFFYLKNQKLFKKHVGPQEDFLSTRIKLLNMQSLNKKIKYKINLRALQKDHAIPEMEDQIQHTKNKL